MKRNAPLENGMRVRVVELGVDGEPNEALSWTGHIISIQRPWARVRDETTKDVYERHIRNLTKIDEIPVRTRKALTSGQTIIVFAPARPQRPRLELDVPDLPPKRRRRAAAPPPPVAGRRRKPATVTRLSELTGPSEDERKAAEAWREAKRVADRKEKRRKAREAAHAPDSTPTKAKPRVTRTRAAGAAAPSKRAPQNTTPRKPATNPGKATKKSAATAPKTVRATPKKAATKSVKTTKKSAAAVPKTVGATPKKAATKSAKATPKTARATPKKSSARTRPAERTEASSRKATRR